MNYRPSYENMNYSYGHIRESLEILKDDIITFHLQDNDGMSDMHLQPPYGTITWYEFIQGFDKLDFNDPIVVATKPWRKNGYNQLIKEVEALLKGNLVKSEIADRVTGLKCNRCGHMMFSGEEGFWCACKVSES